MRLFDYIQTKIRALHEPVSEGLRTDLLILRCSCKLNDPIGRVMVHREPVIDRVFQVIV